MEAELVSELMSWVLQTGGTSAIILIGFYKMWNGTGQSVKKIETIVNKIDKRLIVVETTLKIED